MAYIVYILQSDRDGSFYIGHTARLERDFVGITKDEAHIPKLRFHGGWYIRRNVSRGLKPWRENES